MTNATKAAIIATLNAAMYVLVTFDVAMTAEQQGAIGLFSNAALGLWVALTYQNSNKRLPEGLVKTDTGQIVPEESV